MGKKVSTQEFRDQCDRLRLLTTREAAAKLLTTREAAAKLGVTTASFLRLVKRLGIEPEVVSGQSKQPHYHWAIEAVERLAGEAKKPPPAPKPARKTKGK